MLRPTLATLARLARIALVACACACASPTLPLPPPAIPTIEISSAPGHVHLASRNGAEPNAIIVVVNRDTTLPPNARVAGTVADVSGSWDVDVTATAGDVLDITQQFGTLRSPSTTLQVR
jgi:hypothetical protein